MDNISLQKIPPENAENSLDFNISDIFLLNEVVLSTKEKLSWLSSLRGALKKTNKGPRNSTQVSGLVGRLGDLLTPAEDVFVVYEAQKVFVALVKVQNNEEGIYLIQTVLETSTCLETVTYYLEICRDLLSKQNAQCCVFLARIWSSLSHVVQLFRNGCYRNVTDNFLYQLIAVIFKIIKLASLYKSEDNFRALREIYLCNCSVFLVLLFKEDIKGFVRRKLCLTMYHLLRPSSTLFVNYKEVDRSQGIHPSGNNIKEFAESFCRRVWKIGFVKVILRLEQTDSFTGSASCDKGDSDIDYAHLREWSVLSLGMARLLLKASKEESKENYKLCLDFVEELDKCVRNRLGLTSSVPYDWLPRVFADQDDMWIDALLMLMDLQTSLVPGSLALNPHWCFLQLVSALAYDHLVFLDLLTSPETCFLDYLTRYLKYLLNTWTDFIDTVARFGADDADVTDEGDMARFGIDDADVTDEGDMARFGADDADVTDEGDMARVGADDAGNNDDTDNTDERDISWPQTTCSRHSVNCDIKGVSDKNDVKHEMKHLSFCKESDNDSIGEHVNTCSMACSTQDTKTMANDLFFVSAHSKETESCEIVPISVKTKQSLNQDLEDCKVIAANKDNTGQSSGAVVQHSAGLAMIIGTYSDSEEDMEHDSSTADSSGDHCNEIVTDYDFHSHLLPYKEVSGYENHSQLQYKEVSGYENHSQLQYREVSGYENHSQLQYKEVSGYENHSQLQYREVSGYESHSQLQYKEVSGYENHRQLQSYCTEPAICKSEKDQSMNAKFESQNASLQNTSAVSISELSDISLELDVVDEDISDTSDFSTDPCKDNHGLDQDKSVLGDEESCVMDRTMGMLIRVNLKLQRLWRHKIVSYDPQALLRLLDSVESWYDRIGK